MMESYEFYYGTEELISALMGGVPSLVVNLLNIATYVLTALALYTIAKRRGLNKPWLAWIPVVSDWLLGSLSDQYRYVVHGQNRSKRKTLLILSIVKCVLSIVIVALAIIFLFQIVAGLFGGISEEALMESILGPMTCVIVLCLPLAAVFIAHAVVYYMALYDVFRSLDPANSVVFLVLSIFSGFLRSLFLFFNRDKELGMPPRRQTPEQEWQEPQAYPQLGEESWQGPEDPNYL